MDLLEQSTLGVATPIINGSGLMERLALPSALMYTPPVVVVETGYLLQSDGTSRYLTSGGDTLIFVQ